MDKYRNCQQRRYFHIPNDPVIFLTDLVQCFRGFMWSERCKQNLCMVVWIGCTGIVLNIFHLTGHRTIHMAVHDFVQLQNIIASNGNDVKVLVDHTEHIPISGNFLLVPIPGSKSTMYPQALLKKITIKIINITFVDKILSCQK